MIFIFIIDSLKVNTSKKLVIVETEIWPSLIYCAKKRITLKYFLLTLVYQKNPFRNIYFFKNSQNKF